MLDELNPAPNKVKNVLDSLPNENIFVNTTTEQHEILADKYIAAKILIKKWYEDALHIAIATCIEADAIVSWNFKHIIFATGVLL